jgi:hypothetical protein
MYGLVRPNRVHTSPFIYLYIYNIEVNFRVKQIHLQFLLSYNTFGLVVGQALKH